MEHYQNFDSDLGATYRQAEIRLNDSVSLRLQVTDAGEYSLFFGRGRSCFGSVEINGDNVLVFRFEGRKKRIIFYGALAGQGRFRIK